jgi:hypothetical protein
MHGATVKKNKKYLSTFSSKSRFSGLWRLIVWYGAANSKSYGDTQLKFLDIQLYCFANAVLIGANFFGFWAAIWFLNNNNTTIN